MVKRSGKSCLPGVKHYSTKSSGAMPHFRDGGEVGGVAGGSGVGGSGGSGNGSTSAGGSGASNGGQPGGSGSGGVRGTGVSSGTTSGTTMSNNRGVTPTGINFKKPAPAVAPPRAKTPAPVAYPPSPNRHMSPNPTQRPYDPSTSPGVPGGAGVTAMFKKGGSVSGKRKK